MTQIQEQEQGQKFYIMLYTRKYLDAICTGDKSKEEYYKLQLREEGVKI
ncbi:MAG: hypothetical protein GY853_15905 [PVC group bacterium]|nr:hypothetical protein [PVC group bacterium]